MDTMMVIWPLRYLYSLRSCVANYYDNLQDNPEKVISQAGAQAAPIK